MRKILFLSLALMLSVGLWAETQSVSYRYPVYNTDGVATSGIKEWQTGSVDATVVESATEQVTWNAGWYVVKGEDVQLSKGAACTGDVRLILADGAQLTATGDDTDGTPGIQVSDEGSSLTIYSQTAQSGQLIANGGSDAAGIGGGKEGPGSNITINGGVVTTTGGYRGAGIGGGFKGSGSNIIINGGKVTAKGGDYASGIGGGTSGNGSSIIITEGTVIATGGLMGAGIGGGSGGSGTNITITGGIVTATGGNYGAGIGGGNKGSGSNITITGGVVTTTGGYRGAGIGSGDEDDAASKIYVVATLIVKAGGTNPPTMVIAKHRTDATDIASDLAGKQYVMITHFLNPDKSSPMAVEVTKSGKAIQAVANPEYVDYYQQADSSKVDIIKNGTVVYSVVNPDKVDYVYDGFVDLGLPSGTLWAACNIGATKPEEFGNYYAWGDPRNKTDFSWGTYPYGNSVNHFTKYQNDGKWTLEPEDDMATVIWGPRWRVPTKADFQELYAGCDTIITTYQGVYGVMLVSKVNGNSLFLPAAGNRDGNKLDHAGEGLYYWSSSVVDMAYGNVFWLPLSANMSSWSGYRQLGFSVRPVMNDLNASDHECVSIKGQVKMTEYLPGDTFDFTGLEAYYVPVRGVATKLTDGVTWKADPAIIPAGCTSVSVTATYNGMTSEPLTVNVITKDMVPTITPGSCSFEQSITVTIASKESGTTIYYTLDGTKPTTESTVYKDPFTIKKSTAVKAIVVRNGVAGRVKIAEYAILEYVDLGLPSGTLWATYNVGATMPEEFGNYYAWGETATKEHYDWDSYKWGRPGAFTKYQNDGKTVLDPEDDVATVKLGYDWHTPTSEEWKELLDNCSETYQEEGIPGSWFKSKKNGQQIFIVCAFDAERTGQRGILYWTSSVNNIADGSANYVYRGDKTVISQTTDRMRGLPIRPVLNRKVASLILQGEVKRNSYFMGDAFEIDGLKVDYYPNNGSAAEDVTNKVTWKVEPSIIPEGCKKVTITASYNGLTTCAKQVDIKIQTLEPVFSPNSCLFTYKHDIKISTDVNKATIYYTLDGSTPTTSSSVYTGPVQIDKTTTIKAIAVRDKYTSQEVSATYQLYHPQYIDLGLPSGTLWATCDVGAFSPFDGCSYFAWGEATTKETYTSDNYNYDAPFMDAATANWGPEWRMPTKEEWEELLSSTDRRAYDYSAPGELVVSYCVVFQHKNDKSNEISLLESTGYYEKVKTRDLFIRRWSSTIEEDGSVYGLYMSDANAYIAPLQRDRGTPIRPVLNRDYTAALSLVGVNKKTSYLIGESLDRDGIDAFYFPKGGGAGENVTDKTAWTFEPSIIAKETTSVNVTASYKGVSYSKTMDNITISSVTYAPLPCGFKESVTFSISCDRSDATIYYTLDGTEPTANSTKYTGPITISSTTTVNAIAIKNGCVTPIKTGTYTKTEPYVDLGLPSGLRWGTCNLGTETPYEIGSRFMWGEKKPRTYFDINVMYDTDMTFHDAATANLGSDWRVPTPKEMQELIDNCTYIFYEDYHGSGKDGVEFTSKNNGKTLFFIVTGEMHGSNVYYGKSVGEYWSTEKLSKYVGTQLIFKNNGSTVVGTNYLYLGVPIRPVYDPKK